LGGGRKACVESIRTSPYLKLLCKCRWRVLAQAAGQMSFYFLADAF